MSSKKIIFIVVCSISLYIYYRFGIDYVSIELLDIPSSSSIDLTEGAAESKEYHSVYTAYTYFDHKETSRRTVSGTSMSLGSAREERQINTPNKSFVALRKVILLGEDYSRFGIGTFVDITFSNTGSNDTALVSITQGKASDILKAKIEGFPSSGDYIGSLIKNSVNANFFSSDYKLMDIYVRMDAEGRNFVLPYIEIIDEKPVITGMALFKKDKMVQKINMRDARVMNILRENNSRGILTLQENLKKYTDYQATSKRKVKVEKQGDNYIFTINLSIKGTIISNTLYENILISPDVMKKFENDMAEHVENICNIFIEKMQNNYKVDCLELGRDAAAKYGRGKNTDWDQIVCNSKIQVKANVKLNGVGRGNYYQKH
ncbi:Ger(x)C family spore germination protein [Clostridium lundense]|uniref:Ger(x)C family spore germination protein n=1 Tax=Clostridium lundense TaxID=319475 RepID=UPI00068400F6|nr:Ger(x)C family spore germination protein [Clostridium lundense]